MIPRLAGVVLLVGCAAEPADPSPDDGLPDLEACGPTCGDGPLFVLDGVDLVLDDTRGFDLDGVDDDCGFADADGADGPGIDNRFASVFGVLPPALVTLLPSIFDTAIGSGGMTVLVELVGADDLSARGPAGLVFRAGDGPVRVGADGRLLPHQTFDLAEDPLLGAAEGQLPGDGTLHAGPFDLSLRLRFLDTLARFRLLRARLVLVAGEDDRIDAVIGGVVPLGDALAIAGGLGGDGDAQIKAGLEAVLPLVVDARTAPDGPCDGISGTFALGAVPAFLFEAPP